jgi:hypothetical protein
VSALLMVFRLAFYGLRIVGMVARVAGLLGGVLFLALLVGVAAFVVAVGGVGS